MSKIIMNCHNCGRQNIIDENDLGYRCECGIEYFNTKELKKEIEVNESDN